MCYQDTFPYCFLVTRINTGENPLSIAIALVADMLFVSKSLYGPLMYSLWMCENSCMQQQHFWRNMHWNE